MVAATVGVINYLTTSADYMHQNLSQTGPMPQVQQPTHTTTLTRKAKEPRRSLYSFAFACHQHATAGAKRSHNETHHTLLLHLQNFLGFQHGEPLLSGRVQVGELVHVHVPVFVSILPVSGNKQLSSFRRRCQARVQSHSCQVLRHSVSPISRIHSAA